MAQQVINNGETGLDVRNKLNANFTELYTGKDAVTVNLFSDLPDPTTAPQQKYWVLTASGVFLVNRKSKGAYYSDGAAWNYLGDFPTTADQLGNVPAGNIAATNVQTALNELDGDKQPLATVLTNTTASFTAALETKLSGIATGATANSSDAFLLSRANHTGTQAVATITGLGTLATQSGTFSGMSSGTNTGDQTSIVGITGTIAQFNTALSDGDFATGGGTATGTNTGDQTTISGNAGTATALATSRNFSISGGGITAAAVGFTGAAAVVLNASVDAGHITLVRMANLAANSLIGNNTGGGATPLALTGTQTTAMLDNFTTALKGLAPASGGGTVNFLRADGTWAAPSGGGVSDGDKGDITVSGAGTVWAIDPLAVSFAKIQNASANSVLVGAGSGGTGASYSQITLGANLVMTGTVLSATASGGSGLSAGKTMAISAYQYLN
jgi:hypothetical protein